MRVQLSCVEGWRVQKVSGTLSSWRMVWFFPLTLKLWAIEVREILKLELIVVVVVVVGRCHWSWHGHSQSINAKVCYFQFFWKCPSIFESSKGLGFKVVELVLTGSAQFSAGCELDCFNVWGGGPFTFARGCRNDTWICTSIT
jgi:hypothetical protein